jgi:hypothetical protein
MWAIIVEVVTCLAPWCGAPAVWDTLCLPSVIRYPYIDGYRIVTLYSYIMCRHGSTWVYMAQTNAVTPVTTCDYLDCKRRHIFVRPSGHPWYLENNEGILAQYWTKEEDTKMTAVSESLIFNQNREYGRLDFLRRRAHWDRAGFPKTLDLT